MNQPNQTEQSKEQRLREAAQIAKIKFDKDINDWLASANAGNNNFFIEQLIEFAKSDAAKHYHQPDNKAVDLDAFIKELESGIYINGGRITEYKSGFLNEIKLKYSTPQKALSEWDIDTLMQKFYNDSKSKKSDYELFKNHILPHLKSSQSLHSNQQEEIERLKSKLEENQKAYGELHDNSAINFNNQLRLTDYYRTEMDNFKKLYEISDNKLAILNQELSDLKGKMESDAINFSEWAKINTYGFVRGMGWIMYHGSKEFVKSEELYKQFLTQPNNGKDK